MSALHAVAIFALLSWIGAQPATMEFTTIDAGTNSRVEEPRQVVVRTAAEWSALWKQHAGEGTPPPAVDFTRSMVIGVFAGTRPTAGYAVEIAQIEKRDNGAVVTYLEKAPGPDEMVAQVLTAPFHIVRTERVKGTVTFKRAH